MATSPWGPRTALLALLALSSGLFAAAFVGITPAQPSPHGVSSMVVAWGQRSQPRAGFGEEGRRKARPPPAETTKDPEKRIGLLNRKLNEVLELEKMEWEELNDQQREKLKRKEDLKKEISELTRSLRREAFISGEEEKRAAAPSAADLEDDLVGGRIPRTLLKVLVYCRVSDSGTCQLLLELGKIKVNGVVVDDEVMKVDLIKDKIEFDGELVTLPENRLKPHLRRTGLDEEWEDVPTKYCAKIDGGLLIDLTRNREKERGTYVDKSPFIFKKGGGLGNGGYNSRGMNGGGRNSNNNNNRFGGNRRGQ